MSFDTIQSFDKAIELCRTKYPTQFASPKGYVFQIVVPYGSDRYTLIDEPLHHPGSTRIQIAFSRNETEKFDRLRDLLYRVDVPVSMLGGCNEKWTLYNVRFSVSTNHIGEEDSRPLRIGYYGVTGRPILQRFREHFADAMRGKGHLLHKTWGGIERSHMDYCAVLQVCSYADNLADIYEAEEQAVDQLSLMPHGLNVIPGGYAGIRRLHELRLAGHPKFLSPDERDRLLEQLENPLRTVATHYRTGHLRKLSEDRFTWVKPCWVNLAKVA